jgi:holo-[acyl-carrier protein] synthase
MASDEQSRGDAGTRGCRTSETTQWGVFTFPPLLYHGIDIVEVARVRRAAERWGMRFLSRVFTPDELEECGLPFGAPRYESLAARWAAKEAFAKALGLGLRGLGAKAAEQLLQLREIAVAKGESGQPVLRLSGSAADAAAARGIGALALSLSHSGGMAVASVIGLAAGGPSRSDAVE